jgi:ribonuclease PH
VLDLDYAEDASAETDMNVVMNDSGGFIEIQGTAEGVPFSSTDMTAMLELAATGISQIIAAQHAVLDAD